MTIMAPKYSVIVPVYNAESTLKRCVDSILAQTYSNFELILVNDGSKDNSYDIINEYAANNDNRIKVIHKQNEGVSSARNDALKYATGEYIIFIDSDDFIDPTFIEEFSRYSEDIIICGAKYIEGTKVDSDYPCASTYSGHADLKSFISDSFTHSWFRTPWAKAFRRDIQRLNKIHFNPGLKIGEDTEFVLNFLKYSATVRTIADSLYNYTVIPDRLYHYAFNSDEYKITISSIEKSLSYFFIKEEHNNIYFYFEDLMIFLFEHSMWNSGIRYSINHSIRYIKYNLIKYYPTNSKFKKLRYLIKIILWPLLYYNLITQNVHKSSF